MHTLSRTEKNVSIRLLYTRRSKNNVVKTLKRILPHFPSVLVISERLIRCYCSIPTHNTKYTIWFLIPNALQNAEIVDSSETTTAWMTVLLPPVTTAVLVVSNAADLISR